MKKSIIYLILGLILISFTYATTYNFTFDGGSDEGFTKFYGLNPDYSNNYFTASGSDPSAIVKNLSLNGVYNASIYVNNTNIGQNNYVYIGLANQTTGSSLAENTLFCYYRKDGDFILGYLADQTVCDGVTFNEVGIFGCQIFANGTIQAYDSSGVQCSNDISGYNLIQYDFAYASVKQDQIYLDDYYIDDLTGAPTPSLTINTNLINGTINYNLPNITWSFNGTLSNHNSDYYNCSIYYNDILNETINIDITQNHNKNVSIPNEYDNWFNITLNCSNYEASDSTIYYFYLIDLVNPIILSDFSNNTQYTQLDTVNFNVNGSDTNSFAYNITLFDSNNDVLENYFASNLSTNFWENKTSRTATTIGNYTFMVQFWDSHTKIYIPNYTWSKYTLEYGGKTYKGIKFRNNILNISSDDYTLVNDFSLIKLNDRFQFKFNFTPDAIGEYITLYIGSKKPIIYLNESWFKGHLIIGHKHWIDFLSNDVSDLEINYLTNYNIWRVKFKPQQEQVLFNSIGDLNYAESKWYYTVVSSSSLSDEYLLNITRQLNESNNIQKINIKVLSMIGLFILLGICLLVGGLSKKRNTSGIFFSISGIIEIIISIYYMESLSTIFDYAMVLFLLFSGIGLLFLGIYNILNANIKKEQEKNRRGWSNE